VRRASFTIAFTFAFTTVFAGAIALGGCGTRACKDGTVFLTISLAEMARGASLVAVEAAVDGGDDIIGNFMLRSVDGGTVEIDFPSGYPEGKNVTLHVSATMGAATLATSRLSFVAQPGCTPVSITVGGLDGGSTCDPGSTMCSTDGTMLLTCNTDGSGYDMTACASGCRPLSTPPHCAVLAPSGTADASDYDGTMMMAFTHDVTFDTDQGTITETGGFTRPAGAGVMAGVGFRNVAQPGSTVRVGIFGVKGLSLAAGAHLSVTGKSPLVIVSAGDVSIDGTVDFTGSCATGPFAGGGAGGKPTVSNGDGLGTRGGLAGSGGLDTASGGGGGGFADAGGNGGNGNGSTGGVGGVGFGDLTASPLLLIGGSGGGAGGAGNSGGNGGSGGGAGQIAVDGALTISGAVTAGGCGGLAGAAQGGGGGGGSGGAFLLEARTIHLTKTATLAANGGGGGGASLGQPGGEGGANASFAVGGAGANGGSAGGTGGGSGRLRGQTGATSTKSAGGGGGAAGRIGMKTLSGTITDDGATLSPTRTDAAMGSMQPATTVNVATFQ
jgi:hypothetical protein